MDYREFDAERRRIVHGWGREITDPDELTAAAARLREQAPTIERDKDREKAFRHLANLDRFVAGALNPEPESEAVWAANDAMMRGLQPIGSPAEQQARARAAIDEINRIAEGAPTIGEQIAAQEMNGALAEFIHVLDGTDSPEN
ncbi:hypothetical protein E1263_37875 [Kribbella antibiotica]|uniref:Uncharacterized protein n=1 Tax=Kribbella antibiotica TaxID=190195 RepID=A0A4V2YL89_9ACTN|nr:hypothetical protein [Kribbella antibiotica]TDD45777.1 hypothetical protein E1263_37875 [Kribbella antibiotica]